MFHPYRRQARPKRRSLQIIECDKDKYMVCVEYIYNRNHGTLLERERFLLSNFDFIIIIRLQWHKSFLSGSTFSICGTLLVSFIDGLEKWRGEKLIPIRPKTFLPKRDLHLLRAEKMKVSLHDQETRHFWACIQTIYGRRLEDFLCCCHCHRWWFLIGPGNISLMYFLYHSPWFCFSLLFKRTD